MRKILFILGMMVWLGIVSCQSDHDDYFTNAVITMNAGDTVVVRQVQATAKFTNLNTKQIITSTNFSSNTLEVSLLRGAYQVSIEGLLRYTDRDNHSYLKRFRSQSDYLELTSSGVSAANMKVVFTE